MLERFDDFVKKWIEDLYPSKEYCHSHEFWQKKSLEVCTALMGLLASLKSFGEKKSCEMVGDPFFKDISVKNLVEDTTIVDKCLKAFAPSLDAEWMYNDGLNIDNFFMFCNPSFKSSTNLEKILPQLITLNRIYYIFYFEPDQIPCEFESQMDFVSLSLSRSSYQMIMGFFLKAKDYEKIANINIPKSTEARRRWRELIRVYLKKSRDPHFEALGTKRQSEFIVKDLETIGIYYSEDTVRTILGKYKKGELKDIDIESTTV